MTDKKAITEEERLKLAEQLDQDLEAFINTRQKTPYTEGWKEETWEQVGNEILGYLYHSNYSSSVTFTNRKWSNTHFS